ncbi:response regulator transcription factor [Nocardioides eburneiflavus]|uniref:Response regulator transcription factor n=1 Tax=Nocardioides eburneiflavus TaxID=2518372 RepID=A0A4Z1CKA6_9ACTN|nr:response regulator transcription factor [Nocardioides eburneiflavus]TGN65063.1 response regulator transcription factor [Nocardioides eburneiflavus]
MTALLAERPADQDALVAVSNDVHDPDRCRPQRILVVDDMELVQAGLRALLTDQTYVASCLTAGSLQTAWDLVRRHQPQLVVLSTSVAGESGLVLCRHIRDHMPHVRVLLMSSEGRVSNSLARANGAIGFLPKHLPAPSILAVVERAVAGEQVFPRDSSADSEPESALSRRELDVLRNLVAGLSNPEMALALSLSRHTVKQHTSAVYRKLGVRNRAQAAGRARELGLVA